METLVIFLLALISIKLTILIFILIAIKKQLRN